MPKTIENQFKKQMKPMENHGKQLFQLNKFIKNDFNIKRETIPLKQQKKIFNKFVEESLSHFLNLKKRINPDNLIYVYNAAGRILKGFKNYQNPIKLFKNLRFNRW